MERQDSNRMISFKKKFLKKKKKKTEFFESIYEWLTLLYFVTFIGNEILILS